MEKKQVGTEVNAELVDSFKKFVTDKYGKLRGYYSREVERALSYWLSAKEIRHKEMNPKKSTREIFRNVLSWLREKRGHTPSEVPLKTLKKAISHTRCRGEPPADPRTVRKWFRRFKEEGLIKITG